MRLGIMQPYFAPSLGYFDLIAGCDRWVVFDTAQFRRKSWMVRNRILHPQQGWQYITAHVAKHPLGTPIRDVELLEGGSWREHMVGQLRHYAKRAPHYERTVALVRDALAAEPRSLCRLSVDILGRVCRLLEIRFEPRYFSEMDCPLGPVNGPGDWALRISEALGADEYINPPGGASLFDPRAFAASGIRLTIHRFRELEYQPRGYAFVPMLSIVDVLMWCSTDEIRAHLEAG